MTVLDESAFLDLLEDAGAGGDSVSGAGRLPPAGPE